MFLFSFSELSLPLKDPILIFSLLLFIILFAPILLNKIKIPHLIGLIIAGAIIGPNGFNLMERDMSIILFGTVGLLYIMFLAGLEIDLGEFKKNSGKSIYFGLLTFIFPMLIGTFGAYYILGYRNSDYYPLEVSILFASIIASHTLISYPIVSKLGISKNRAVNVAIGGTIITDILALLVLAVIVGMTTSEITPEFWWTLSISVLIFGGIVLYVFPILARNFFKKYDDSVLQYIFVLGLVFLASFLAEVAGLEHIIGAFLAGLALNKLIPITSPLMNRIEFMGNALFIPFFLIGVGMLVDFRVFFTDFETILVAVVMIAGVISAKYIAAWITHKTFRFSKDEMKVLFGLTVAQAAATLAVVLVGHNIILNQPRIDHAMQFGIIVEPVRLLGDSVLNGSILTILVTCTIASIWTQRAAENIAVSDALDEEGGSESTDEKILIPVSNKDVIVELINLCVSVKYRKNKENLYALHVIDDENINEEEEKKSSKVLEHAAVSAAAIDNKVNELLRYDLNVVNGINSVVKEFKITDIIIGMHQALDESDQIMGDKTKELLETSNITTLIYRPIQPLNTIKRHLVIIPEKAERESGFHLWLVRIWNLARNTGSKVVFYGSKQSLREIQIIHKKHPIQAKFVEFTDWEGILALSREIKIDDHLIFVFSRRNGISYNSMMEKIPVYINRYFMENNIMVIYPQQNFDENYGPFNLSSPSAYIPVFKR